MSEARETQGHRQSFPPGPRTYVQQREAKRRAALAIGSGVFGLIMAALLLLVELRTPPGERSSWLPGALGGMAAVSLGSLLFGSGLARSPARITLDDEGLLLEGLLSKSRVAWRQIAELQREKTQEHARAPKIDVLVIRDERGKKIAHIPGTFVGFVDLVAEVEARSAAARGLRTYDRAKELARKLRAQRRDRRLLGGMGLMFFGGGAFLTWTGAVELIQERALSAEGVPRQARIVRRYLHNVTPRLEYVFVDDGGATFGRNVAMERSAWEALEGSERVVVVYVPSNPKWNRLVAGEVRVEGSPLQTLLIGGLSLVPGTGALILIAKGYCGFDAKKGRLRLIRLGEIDDALESPEAGPRG